MENQQAIGDRFRAFRETYTKLSQDGLAESISTTQATVSRIELGKRLPNQAILISMARKFGLNPEWALTGLGEPKKKSNKDNDATANIMARLTLIEREMGELKQTLQAILAKLEEE